MEVGVQVVERWILARLRHHVFRSLSALNAVIAELLVELNERAFQKLPGSRRALFERLERPALKALPEVPYEPAEWLRCRAGNQAYRQGLSVRYLRLPRLLEQQLRIAHGDGSYARLMSQLAKTELLILDDWGLVKLSVARRNDLLEVIEDRHALRATLIASQLPVEHWHDTIGEATVTDAILDRLLHNAHRIALSGDSMRKTSEPPAQPTA